MTESFRNSSCVRLIFSSFLVLAFSLLRGSGFAQDSSSEPEVAALVKQGKDALAAKNFQEASKDFKKAGKLAHDNCFDCWVGLARALDGLGDDDGAKNAAARAIASAPDDSARADAHVLRGDVMSQQARVGLKYDANKMKEAEAEYTAATQLAPQKPENYIRVGIALAKQMRDQDAKAAFEKYLQLAPNGPYAATAKSFEEQPQRARYEAAPQFSLTTLQGNTITLGSLSGKYVVLDFWATWCPSCRASLGDMKELARKYSDRVVIISVSDDEDDAKWKEFVAQKKMDWVQCRDRHVGKLFGVHGIPTYIVIDPDGFVRDRIVGENPQQSIVHRLKDSLASSVGS